jgi:hypothetical protein
MTVPRATPEARLLDAGWDPPEALRTALERREALRSAIDSLKTRGYAATEPILGAIKLADSDSIITAIVSDAIGRWLDVQCQRPDSELTAWSASAEQAVVEAVYADARVVLRSLQGFDSPDGAYILALAQQAATPLSNMFDSSGQPVHPRPDKPSWHRVMVAR